jgi:hypothetical protein
MSNSYKYIDPDYTYTDPKTGLLRNLQDISVQVDGFVLRNPPQRKATNR